MGNSQSRGVKRKCEEDGEDLKDLNKKVNILDLSPTPIASMTYDAEMWGQERDYKNSVVQMLSNEGNRLMFRLRMMLLVEASKMGDRQNCLIPFPPCFYDGATNTKDFSGLCEHLGQIISCTSSLDDPTTELTPKAWELLYWSLTNPLTLEPVPLTRDTYSKMIEMAHLTGLKNLPIPDNSTVHLFKITQTQPSPKFHLAKKTFGSFYAFHGSPLYNFHSIIHRGFLQALNVRRVHGDGTYSSPNIEISKAYSRPWCGPWTRNIFGGRYIKAVAICEVINTNITVVKDYCYVCKNDEHMRLTHIYIFSASARKKL